MNTVFQSDMHPDAESLNALMEKALSAAERDHVLAHVAACERCRKIVYFATDAAGAELTGSSTAQAARATTTLEQRPHRSWFLNWRLAWVPALVVSGIVGVAVLEHAWKAPLAMHRAQMERLPVAPQAVSAPPAPSSSGTPQLDFPAPTVAAKHAPVAKQAQVGSAGAPFAQPDASVSQSAKQSLGSSHAMRRMDALRSEPAAPLAARQLPERDTLKKEDAKDLQSKTVNSAALSEGNAVSESGANNAQLQGSSNMAALVPAAPRQSAPAPEAADHLTFGASGGTVSNAIGKLAIIKLPSGLDALSVATIRNRTVAIDATGSVFVSEEAGKEWSVITPAWTGRATVVRAIQFPIDSKANKPASDSLFELINDRSQRWTSVDGKIWIAADPIQK